MRIALLVLSFLGLVFLKSTKAQEISIPRITQNFQQFFDNAPQEKVYLHLDKAVYSAGENIWLKAYLTDATYHVPNLLSKFVYVELTNQDDSICQRIKLRQIDSCFYGNFNLPPDIIPGNYCIRAFTDWMQNNDEAFFFKKNITVVNPIFDVNIHIGSHLQEEKVYTTLTLVNSGGTPYANQRLKLILRHNHKIVKTNTGRTNEKGQYTTYYSPTDSINNIILSFPYDLPFAFRQTLYPPNISSEFDLQFFPEGGNLLAGIRQNIAFKAIGANGSAIAVKGEIYDSKDKAVSMFTTLHRGMGKTSLSTNSGEHYYAIAQTPEGIEKRIDLPAPVTSGYALKATWQSDTAILLSVQKASQTQATTPLYLIIHTRGRLMNVVPVDDHFVGAIDPSQFPAGITHFVLLDANGKIYSERLCFIHPDLQANQIDIQSDKNNYDRREKVELSMQLPQNHPLQPGNFSLSVTDDNMVRNDSLADNIVSYLLLSSDLKGYIEAPGSYIHESSTTTDLLMMTHGWTRFRIADILKSQYPQTTRPVELSQQLFGNVTNLYNKPLPNAKVQIFVPKQNLLGEIRTNEQGKFVIRNIDFPDSTLFLIRGYKEKGGKHVNIQMDSFTSVPPTTFFPDLSAQTLETPEHFLNRFKGDYYYQDGVKIYVLDAVNVIRHRPNRKKQEYVGEYTDMADQILGQNELSKFTATSIYQLLMRLPGVYVTGENVSIRGGGTPLYLVDGLPTESDVIGSITPDDVDNVGVIKDGARLSFFGPRGSNGVIIINTKHGDIGYRSTPGLIKHYPLGYFEPDDFYIPAYDQPDVKNKSEIDYRNTIYWNPIVSTDSTGNAKISFYTADLPSTYTITIEGMTKNGGIYRGQKQIRRK